MGCQHLVYFTDSTHAMEALVDPSPHLGQESSLAACAVLRKWFACDPLATLHLWHIPSKAEWKVHHEAHNAAKEVNIALQLGCQVSFDFVCSAKEV